MQQPDSYLMRDPSLSIQLSLKSSYKYDILLPLVMRLFKKFLCCQCDENHTITLLALLRLRHLAKCTGLIFRLGAKSIGSFMFFNVSKDSWFTNTILVPVHQIMPVILDLAEQDATRASCVPFIFLLKKWNEIPLEISDMVSQIETRFQTFGPKLLKFIPYFRPKQFRNHTLGHQTYLHVYTLYR